MDIRSTSGNTGYGLSIKSKSEEKSRFSRSTWRVATLVMILNAMLGNSSCVVLTQISDFAKASQAVGKTFSSIQDGAEPACKLANAFRSEKFNNMTGNKQNCQYYASIKAPLAKVNQALFNYITALGNLANDDLSKVGSGFDNIQSELKTADPTLTTAELTKATAAGGLAKVLTNLWASGYRQHELAKIIGDNNQAVQDVTSFLADYAANRYFEGLRYDYDTENSYCKNFAPPNEPLAPGEPLGMEILDRHCTADLDRLEAQKKAVKDFQTALGTIGERHKKLFENKDHLDAKQLAELLGQPTVSLASAAISIKNAF
ncbi:MAG: hypothetical protein P4N24_14590 [Acidobacteriota bacterium]|nr:hypothetical protein [Acidobacteriota bacterium]